MLLPDGLSDRRRRAAYRCLLAYLGVLVVDVLAEALRLDAVAGLMLAVAVPLLVVVVVLTVVPSRGRTLLLVALTFSWLGDVLGVDVLIKIVFFLGAQLAYCLRFWPLRRRSLLARRPPAFAYALVMTAVITVMAGLAEGLGPLVVVYGGLLALMVALASGVNRATLVGAALFLISDVILGYRYFVAGAAPVSGVLAMTTYLSAQLLITLGLVHHEAGRRRTAS